MAEPEDSLTEPFHVVLRRPTDFDVAAFALGRALGLFPQDDPEAFLGLKHVVWSRHPVGEALHRMLRELAAAGVLDCTRSGDLFWLRPPYLDGPPSYDTAPPYPSPEDPARGVASCHRREDVREAVCELCDASVWLPEEYVRDMPRAAVWCRPCAFAQARMKARDLARGVTGPSA